MWLATRNTGFSSVLNFRHSAWTTVNYSLGGQNLPKRSMVCQFCSSFDLLLVHLQLRKSGASIQGLQIRGKLGEVIQSKQVALLKPVLLRFNFLIYAHSTSNSHSWKPSTTSTTRIAWSLILFVFLKDLLNVTSFFTNLKKDINLKHAPSVNE